MEVFISFVGLLKKSRVRKRLQKVLLFVIIDEIVVKKRRLKENKEEKNDILSKDETIRFQFF
jgi:hypothetical protein